MTNSTATAIAPSRYASSEDRAGGVEHSPRTGRASLLKRAVAAFATMLALAGILTLAPTTEASAATVAYGTVCFTQRGGGAFTGQVSSEYYTTAGWARYSSFVLPTGGCQTVVFPTGYYWRFTVTHRGFYGSTSYNYVTSGYYYRFTGVASW